jgi:ArsR family transcriptional regulator
MSGSTRGANVLLGGRTVQALPDDRAHPQQAKIGTRSPPRVRLTIVPCFCNHQNMPSKKVEEQVAKFADMFSAMGTEARLRITQLLLSAHPDGLVVTEIQEELDIPNSTLSHHLDKLKHEGLVQVRRESTFLRYTADTDALQQLLQFLYAECCTRNKALKPEQITECCR